MIKNKLLNADILEVISKMGHTDEIVIADAGLPIPDGVKRIDLALTAGHPSFMDVLKALLDGFECESYTLATEIKDNNPVIESHIHGLLEDKEVTYISHEAFKTKTAHAKAVIRTGECSPYANVILKSGVIF